MRPEDVFLNETDIFYYNNMLSHPEYYRTHEGLEAKVVMMTPEEYMQECARVQMVPVIEEYKAVNPRRVEQLVEQVKAGHKLYLPFIDYNLGVQEGRHRVMAAKELGLTKVPVIVVKKADPEWKPEYSAKTVRPRRQPSRALRILLNKGLITKGAKILDLGCGKGTDVEYLRANGYDAYGYDPYQAGWDNESVLKQNEYDIVLNFYVLNVLPPEHRAEVIITAWRVLKHGGKAYFAVRDVSESGRPRGVPYKDGILINRWGVKVFQTWFTPESLEYNIKQVGVFTGIKIVNRRQPLIVEALKA